MSQEKTMSWYTFSITLFGMFGGITCGIFFLAYYFMLWIWPAELQSGSWDARYFGIAFLIFGLLAGVIVGKIKTEQAKAATKGSHTKQ